jgi:CHASE2 domain-containing sensor protein
MAKQLRTRSAEDLFATHGFRSPWARLVTSFLAVLAVSTGVVLMSWLGDHLFAEQVHKRAMARLVAPITGWAYGFGARDQVAVLHVDSDALAESRETWPVTYRFHARQLERLRRQEPRAVFVDFIFESDRNDPSIRALVDVLRAMHADGIPLYIAMPETDRPRLRGELQSLVDEKVLIPVSVFQVKDPYDQVSWGYRLASKSNGLRSAALAIATDALRVKGREYDLRGQDMALVWGTRAPAVPFTWRTVEGPAHCSTQSALWRLLPPGLSDLASYLGREKDGRPLCPFSEALSVRELPVDLQGDAPDLQQRIKGRFVLYGASFDASDYAVSPVHASIPGVFVHAMALDNLLQFGDRWKREREEGESVMAELFRAWRYSFVLVWTAAAVSWFFLAATRPVRKLLSSARKSHGAGPAITTMERRRIGRIGMWLVEWFWSDLAKKLLLGSFLLMTAGFVFVYLVHRWGTLSTLQVADVFFGSLLPLATGGYSKARAALEPRTGSNQEIDGSDT